MGVVRCESSNGLHDFVVADGHAGWGFEGFGWREFGGVVLEVGYASVQGVDMGALFGIDVVRRRPTTGKDLMQFSGDDGAGLIAGGWVGGEREQGFYGAGFDGAADFGREAVALGAY